MKITFMNLSLHDFCNIIHIATNLSCTILATSEFSRFFFAKYNSFKYWFIAMYHAFSKKLNFCVILWKLQEVFFFSLLTLFACLIFLLNNHFTIHSSLRNLDICDESEKVISVLSDSPQSSTSPSFYALETRAAFSVLLRSIAASFHAGSFCRHMSIVPSWLCRQAFSLFTDQPTADSHSLSFTPSSLSRIFRILSSLLFLSNQLL